MKNVSLTSAIDIPHWLEQDRELSWRERVLRDQQKIQELDLVEGQPLKQVLYWWDSVKTTITSTGPGRVIASFFRIVTIIVIAAGFISGAGLASVLLHYDGSEPINIFTLLGWLVLLPLVFMLLSLCIPVLRKTNLLNDINIGGIVLAVLKRKNALLETFFSSTYTDANKEKLMHWRLLLFSQQFGVAFSLAAFITLVVHVSFSDLAFGWSTTLKLDANTLHDWTRGMALPWAMWVPEATPSLNLIEQSQFFRLENSSNNLVAEVLTNWWKFIAMCLFVYGILSRLIVMIFAKFKYQQAINEMLMEHSEITALLDRMQIPLELVQSHASQVKAESNVTNNIFSAIKNNDVVILWNDIKLNGINLNTKNIINSGGQHSSKDDLNVLQSLRLSNDTYIYIVTKAWEPPLLEFHDFIKIVREHVGTQIPILVQPVGLQGEIADATDVEVWRQSIAKLQDPKIYVP